MVETESIDFEGMVLSVGCGHASSVSIWYRKKRFVSEWCCVVVIYLIVDYLIGLVNVLLNECFYALT